jgi:hypothetical protein
MPSLTIEIDHLLLLPWNEGARKVEVADFETSLIVDAVLHP